MEGLNYESVVELIRTAGQSVEVEVVCLPELIELSERGALEILEDSVNVAPSPPTTSQKGRGLTSGTLRRARSKRQKEQFRVSVYVCVGIQSGLSVHTYVLVYRLRVG